MQQTTNDVPLLLGFQGWPNSTWLEGYFPEDLPDDWQFAYYTNEASCLLLPNDDWQVLDADEVEDWCDDAPEHFRFYLQQATGVDVERLDPFIPRLGAVLVADKNQGTADVPCLYPAENGYWLDMQGQARLFCCPWQDDLRQLREFLQLLPTSIEAIVFTDGGSPRQLHDVRILVELLGIG